MAELVDALVSGTSGAIRGGSSPLLGTNNTLRRGTFPRETSATAQSAVGSKLNPDRVLNLAINRSPKIAAGVQKPPGFAALSMS